MANWKNAVADNGGTHPNCGTADTRLLHRARHTAVPATRGGGLHPNREVWVRDPRNADISGFKPTNRTAPSSGPHLYCHGSLYRQLTSAGFLAFYSNHAKNRPS